LSLVEEKLLTMSSTDSVEPTSAKAIVIGVECLRVHTFGIQHNLVNLRLKKRTLMLALPPRGREACTLPAPSDVLLPPP